MTATPIPETFLYKKPAPSASLPILCIYRRVRAGPGHPLFSHRFELFPYWTLLRLACRGLRSGSLLPFFQNNGWPRLWSSA
jgi:hypothetical protein